MKTCIRTILTALAIAATTAGGTLAATLGTHTASASPGNIVTFGDSIPANPSVAKEVGNNINPNDPNIPRTGVGCPTDNRFTNAVERGSGKHTDNYTCAGAALYSQPKSIDQQIDRAQQDGALDGGTEQVVVVAGANDTYPWVGKKSVEEINQGITDNMGRVIDRIHTIAPQARVKVVGYPHITNGNGQVCFVNVIPGVQTPDPFVRAADLEWGLEGAARVAAEQHGAQFVSLKDLSNNHEMCSSDRWMAGVVDTTAGPHELMLHLTDHASDVIGEFVGRA